eukprot:CAMPEP_0168552718 /NCGR_PEP_ID=MMETSP0413-20121227/6867_1 /TAXON_ID=136452 /ORGANISM="Filamoeba nolandi, Strain NC-AS-23-1" /LENGTH=183 /DNA_ID=CAMNT_0008583353 /DNA_START=278 /DNA_END=829 /DNA_ORIENTATION=+
MQDVITNILITYRNLNPKKVKPVVERTPEANPANDHRRDLCEACALGKCSLRYDLKEQSIDNESEEEEENSEEEEYYHESTLPPPANAPAKTHPVRTPPASTKPSPVVNNTVWGPPVYSSTQSYNNHFPPLQLPSADSPAKPTPRARHSAPASEPVTPPWRVTEQSAVQPEEGWSVFSYCTVV